MRTYRKNSPEAVSRIVAMALISDAELDGAELEALENLDFYERIGIDKPAFADVFADYCRDISQAAGKDGRVKPLDAALIDQALAEVDDPVRRLTAVVAIAAVMKADGGVSNSEAALFNHILKRWALSPDAVEAEV
jgi:hypothetical protein